MLNPNHEAAAALPANLAAAFWQQPKQNEVLLCLPLHHTSTPEAQVVMLEDVGHLIRVTKDRLRDIQNQALLKLRGLLAERS